MKGVFSIQTSRKWGRIKLRLSFVTDIWYFFQSTMFYVTIENKTRTLFCAFLFRLERCSYRFPFSWLYSKARSRCTRETFGWMNSVCAFSFRSGGGARGVAWRYNALNAFARVPAEMEGRHRARAVLTSEREFPRLRDIYVQSMTVYTWPFGFPEGFYFLTTPEAWLLLDEIKWVNSGWLSKQYLLH